MRKQTKLVAVLSTAALLALGASMSSFAATGWAEENGTWVYYDKAGDTVTETWAKSGDNWFYLNDDGEMATDAIVEYKDNYYYVDVNGAMVANTWVSVENEDYDGEDEPTTFWYYFGANGKAYTGKDDKASFKTINGKKYTFDSEGRMQSGWIVDGKRNTDTNAWETAEYYCGDENDGAQAIGWRFIEIEDENYESDNSPMTSSKNVFDDQDQTRWFYFKSNGKKENSKDGVSINGARYSFDEGGRMNGEWATKKGATPTDATASDWRYYNTPEEGARATKGWFKTVADERFIPKDYQDDKERWYYADGNGQLITDEIKEIAGKRYVFDENGIMKSGMLLLQLEPSNSRKVAAIEEDDDIDTEETFKANVNEKLAAGYNVYYFGGGDDGSMRTGKANVSIDDETFAFNFGKSGLSRGVGKNGEDSKKIYQGGMLLKADKDDKYAVIRKSVINNTEVYDLLSTEAFLHEAMDGDTNKGTNEAAAYKWKANVTKENYFLVNTSGTIQSGKSTAKDGNDFTFKQTGRVIDRVFIKD